MKDHVLAGDLSPKEHAKLGLKAIKTIIAMGNLLNQKEIGTWESSYQSGSSNQPP